MKRKYHFEDVERFLNSIAQIPSPLGGVFVGMDVITGFPGETDEEFEWTYKTLMSLPWCRLHVFPYSERKGTPATRLPGSVPQHIRIQRAKKLSQLSMDRLSQHYRQILTRCVQTRTPLQSVLLERGPDSSWLSGYTPNYLRVMIRNESSLNLQRNQIVNVSPQDLILDSNAGDVALMCSLL